MLAQLKGGVNMVVKGYYIWIRNDGVFETRFYLQRILVKSKNILLLIVSNILVIAKKKKHFQITKKRVYLI